MARPLATLLVMLALISLPVAASAAAAVAGKESAAPPIGPSINKGRAGTYLVETRQAGYNYYVFVPASYSDANPAGLHVHFHGQASQKTAPNFDNWNKYFLTPYNLIGINMQYMDGDNTHDTEGKLKTAQGAIAQVMADYKIIAGRGAICSFSGGGCVHGMFAAKFSKDRGVEWPFCQSALYSSNYRVEATIGTPMGWYIGVGTKEWSLASLGSDAKARTGELLSAIAKGGDPDVLFNVIQDKDHTILEVDVQEAGKIFPRSDLAYAPFLYAPDYPDKELRQIVAGANALQLGGASAAVAKLLAKADLVGDLKKKAEDLDARIIARIDRVTAMAKELCANDPVLAAFYLPMFINQCKGSASEKGLRAMSSAASKEKGFSATLAAHAQFTKNFSSLMPGDARIPPDKKKEVDSLNAHFPATSLIGRMVTNLLSLK
ncbi:MAG: hypothetical protein H0W83_17225 [Planctomycetes bacterium]|nr:hypothetical protein [Planctomycetota bacterium]